jgi:hypothetical protein
VLCSSQDYLRTGTRDLDHPVSYRCKKTLTGCEQLKEWEGAIRVKVFINKQGYLIRWKSEKLGTDTSDDSTYDNSSKMDGSDGEGESDDLGDSHDNGFANLAKEHKEEENKKRQMGKSGGISQADEMEWETMAQGEFSLSQTRQQKEIPECSSKQQMEVDLMRGNDKLEKEKEEMSMMDAIFEEKTEKLAHII